ncbi:MAG: NADH-quinone oxidoreductase subunit C [Anaerolineales bacterium]|nr:NADH-quinone oxidoreductase subunit C [Anaerolineales bacterium]
MSHLETTLAALQDKFGDVLEQVVEFRGETTVVIHAAANLAVLQFLKETLGYTFLADLTAYDDWPEEPRFKVIYQLRNLFGPVSLRVKCPLAGDAPQIASVTGLYPAANWPERELFDMFGLQITGHPDLRRILMPSDWQGHPLRKDYPLGYEEVQFTFNFDDIDKKKPYAKE